MACTAHPDGHHRLRPAQRAVPGHHARRRARDLRGGSFRAGTVRKFPDSPSSRVRRFRWQNRGIAIPGDVLTCSGTVAKAEEGVVECELEERNQKGELCASGWARVDLPRRG